ncbi:hypothetical protein RchiOBHm_Chr4g0444041 [Rosa chinensis]|uniref:Uncharacterized protein n=1 Tax=Rosa chinensis TaxID=74649 RepID=A0A2P6R433_ROSCH|nr:hypothetical protein RchiOBHm_Chr4g0444041 [Rosa chinensis]
MVRWFREKLRMPRTFSFATVEDPIDIWLLAARIEEFEIEPIQFQVWERVFQFVFDLLAFVSFMRFRIIL